MSPFSALCLKEVAAALRSPGTWVLLAGFQLLASIFFLLLVVNTKSSLLVPLYYNVGMLFVFLAPILTATSFGPEWREGTMELLLTSSIRARHIVLAKYAGALAVIGVATLLSAQFPIWVGLIGSTDPGMAACALLGCFLLGAAAGAIGLFAAAVSRSVAGAATLGFASTLAFWFLHSLGLAMGVESGGWTDRFSLYIRFTPFTRGILDSGDAAFLVLLAAGFVTLAAGGLEAARSARS